MAWLLVNASGSTPKSMADRLMQGEPPSVEGTAEQARAALHATQSGIDPLAGAEDGAPSSDRASIDPAHLFSTPAVTPEGGLIGVAKRLVAPIASLSRKAAVAVDDAQVNELCEVLADTIVAFHQLGAIYERADALAETLCEPASDLPVVQNVAGLSPEQKGDVQRFLQQLRKQAASIDTRTLLWNFVGHASSTSLRRSWDPQLLGTRSCQGFADECDAVLQRLTKDAAENAGCVTRGSVEQALELNAVAVVLSQQLHNVVSHLADLDVATGRQLFARTFAEHPRWAAPLPIRWSLEQVGDQLVLIEKFRVGKEDAHGSMYRYASEILSDLRAIESLIAASGTACTTAVQHYPRVARSRHTDPATRELTGLLGDLWPGKLRDADALLQAATRDWQGAQTRYLAFVKERPRTYSDLLAFTKRLRGNERGLALPSGVPGMPRDARSLILDTCEAALRHAEAAARLARTAMHGEAWPSSAALIALKTAIAAMRDQIRRPLHCDSGADVFLRNCDPVYIPPLTH